MPNYGGTNIRIYVYIYNYSNAQNEPNKYPNTFVICKNGKLIQKYKRNSITMQENMFKIKNSKRQEIMS